MSVVAQAFVHLYGAASFRGSDGVSADVSFPGTVTLQDVADAAGVSVSTASRSLNGKAVRYRISAATQQRVIRAAEKLGFQPSQMARAFLAQRSGLIAVLVPDVANSFFASIAREISVAAEAAGFCVILADTRESTDVEKRVMSEMLARRVEGLVVCPVGADSEHLVAADRSGVPLVVVDRGFSDTDLLQVTSDHREGSRRAMQTLIKAGHRRIGILQGRPGTLPNDERLAGAKEACREAGVTLRASAIAGDNFTEASGFDSAIELLENQRSRTALFALATPNALGALRAAVSLGRHVPDDLSLVAFDDSPFSEFMKVPLTTVCQDVTTLGQTAARVILKRMQSGKKPQRRLHQIGVTLIRRSSIGKV